MKRVIFLATLTMILFCTVTLGADQRMTRFDKIKYQVGYCESGNRHDGVWGDNGRAYGRYQFHASTFNWLKNKYGRTDLQRKSLPDQELLFKLAVEDGRGKLWSCFKKCKIKEV